MTGIVKFEDNKKHLGAKQGDSISTLWAWPTTESVNINFTSYPSTEAPFQMYIEIGGERLYLHQNILFKALEWSADYKDVFILVASHEGLQIAKYHMNRQPLEILGITSSSNLKLNRKDVKDDWAPLFLSIFTESGQVQVPSAPVPVTPDQLLLPVVHEYSALPTGTYRLLHGGHEYIFDWKSSDTQGSGRISSPSLLSASKILFKWTSNGHVANVTAPHGEFDVSIDVVRPGSTHTHEPHHFTHNKYKKYQMLFYVSYWLCFFWIIMIIIILLML